MDTTSFCAKSLSIGADSVPRHTSLCYPLLYIGDIVKSEFRVPVAVPAGDTVHIAAVRILGAAGPAHTGLVVVVRHNI